MKYLMLITFTMAHINTSAQNEKTKKELQQLSWDWMNAWKEKDTVVLKKLLAPEYRLLALINGELVSINRERWLKTAPLYVPTSLKIYNFDIRLYGNTAVVQSWIDQQATLNGQDRSGTFQVTDIWVKNEDTWQVVHRHTTLKPAGKEPKP